MSKHTPGPWEAVSKEGRIGVDVRSVSGRRVAATYGVCNAPRSKEGAKHQAEEDRANAIFIAAAPDLAAALQDCMKWLSAFAQGEPWLLSATNRYKKYVAALQKAGIKDEEDL